MVFSSVPLYLDPPNWQHEHQNPQPGGISTEIGSQQLPPPPPLPGIGGGGGDGGSIRPGSMAERARLGKIPQPETALKCPRCESTNTKFCYFNNYSLSQPRHFCKTCRRYWTRGGALRNVPVGGGCRRNKRSSKANNSTDTSTRSKSPAVILTENNQLATSTTTTDSIFHALPPPLPPQLPILPPLHYHLSDFNSGLGFGGIQAPEVAAAGGGGSLLSSGLVEQWRLPQYPFLSGGLEPTTGFYSLESDGQLRSSKPLMADNSGDLNQFASVKMEDNNIQGLNLSRNFLGITGNDNQYWSAINNNNAWTTDHHNLPGFNPSSTTHLL